MEKESLDEEDLETLIVSNHTNNLHSSALQIGDSNSPSASNFIAIRKMYFIAIFVLLFFILVLSSLNIGGFFHAFPTIKSATYQGSRMRESELRALSLLKNQQLELLNLWDRYSNSSNGWNLTMEGNEIPLSSRSSLFDEFSSALLEQVKLNKAIQQSLLSSRQVGNVSGSVDGSVGVGSCRKIDVARGRRTIEWRPRPNRYLFALCVSGQMSNHLICLEKHMFFAALLDRVLVFPSPNFDYQYDRVVDINHINECFGREVVISYKEFSTLRNNHLQIDRFICYVAEPPCFVDSEHIKGLKSLGLSMGKIEAAWPGDGKPDVPKKRKIEDVLPKFKCDDEVLAIGDMFFASVEEEWVTQPGGPLAHKCKTVIQPSRIIVLTAQRFIQTFLGGNFIALHFRRHGFLKFCNAKRESCFYPIPQAAECILRVIERANAPVIYLSTDAAESETDLLQSLILHNGKTIPLFKRPSHTSVEKWDAYLYRNSLGGDVQVDAMLDKTICAMSTVFIGASGSTFTDDIIRLRKDWETASLCDEYLCPDEQPNFIADSD